MYVFVPVLQFAGLCVVCAFMRVFTRMSFGLSVLPRVFLCVRLWACVSVRTFLRMLFSVSTQCVCVRICLQSVSFLGVLSGLQWCVFANVYVRLRVVLWACDNIYASSFVCLSFVVCVRVFACVCELFSVFLCFADRIFLLVFLWSCLFGMCFGAHAQP